MNLETHILRISKHDDQEAFRAVFEYFFPGLLSFAGSILKSQPLAEEVVEDVFVKLWQRRSTLPDIKNLSYYLYTATRNACINALEKQKKYRQISLDEAGEELTFSFSHSGTSLINKENCLRITEAINQLPPRCRLIFRLIKEDGLKYREVSRLLNISEKTVEAQMSIAIKKLVEKLKVDLPEFGGYYPGGRC